MNALREVVRAPSPLVWTTGTGVYCWVENGVGHMLLEKAGKWVPLVDFELCAGRVLSINERLSLVLTYGRPS